MRTIRSRFLALVCLAVALCGIGVAAGRPAAAIDNGSLGIRPSNESDFFHLSVLAGESLNASAIVSNHTAKVAQLVTYAVDGLTASTGTFALKSRAQASDGIGLWARVGVSAISVAAHGTTTVPFTLTVPAGTPAGDYSGGIIIQTEPVPGVPSESSGSPVRIDIVQRQGVRIYLTVPGVVRLGVTAGDLSWHESGESVVLSLAVTNTGNSTLRPTARATVSRWFGEKSVVAFVAPESVPPGTTVVLSTRFAASQFAQLASISARVASPAGALTREATIIAVPLSLIIAGITVLGSLVFALWRLGRFVRRTRRALSKLALANMALDDLGSAAYRPGRHASP